MHVARASRHHTKFHRLFCAIAIALFTLIPAIPTHAKDVNNFYFNDFSADYYVSRDSDGVSHMRVTETLTATFPNYNQNLGIVRYIPYTNNGGSNTTIPSKSALNISITRNGHPEPIYSIEKEDGYYSVSTGDDTTYLHGQQTFVLTYEFEKVITDFGDYQELYWDTNGTSWRQRFEQLSARVHFSDDYNAIIPDRTSCYVGKSGSKNDSRCSITPTADGYEFSASSLYPGENLTFAIALQPGTFAVTPTYDMLFLVSLAISILVLITIVILVSLYRSLCQDKYRFYKNLFLAPEYQPMHGVSVAEASRISIKSTSDSRSASLISLAVNHKITLIRSEKKKFGKYTWRIRVDSLSGISPEEKIILSLVIGGEEPAEGQEYELKRHNSNSYLEQLGRDYSTKVQHSVEKKGFFIPKKPRPESSKYATATALVAILWTIASFLILASIIDSEFRGSIIPGNNTTIFAYIGINLATIIIAIVGIASRSAYTKRSEKGLRAARYFEGLELYMKMAEQDRLKFLQSVDGADTSPAGVVKLYEKLLPYAIIFNLEQSWMKELERYYQMADLSTPDWYVGGIITMHDFHSFISTTSSQIMQSASSSSGSGSGGGGFSGGGGGGGGGGGR